LGESFVADSLVRSRPGDVVQDTLVVTSGDTTFEVNSYYASLLNLPDQMVLGRKDDFQSTMLVRVDFSKAGADAGKTVQTADLVLLTVGTADTLRALFYETLVPFETGDTLSSLSLAASPIPDGTLLNVDREMKPFPREYSLPPGLVQDWIRGTQPHNGIAIVLNDTTTTREMTFATRSADDYPFLRVLFTDASQSSYPLLADGTFVEDLSTTTELRLSDGDTKRIYLPVRLSGLPRHIMLNQARLIIHVVSLSASDTLDAVELYAPADSVVGSAGILRGTAVSSRVIGGSGVVSFSIRNIVSSFLARPETNHGFVVRYVPEGNSIRRIDFFSSAAADSLKPRMVFTYTLPPDFPDI
jgi:hypothetical protein